MSSTRSEIRDGMKIDWNVGIKMDDGLILSADIFRPIEEGKYPVILSYSSYAKGLAFQEGYPEQWENMVKNHPDIPYGSTNKYQNWEVVDPEKWVPDGYVVIRVDSRGSGRSPGYLDPWCPRETQDIYQCIEWAGTQPWSNGNVGMNGISYYSMNQWWVGSLQPPHLKAMCVWEGAADFYRDVTYHGGILMDTWDLWYKKQVKSVQYGRGELGPRNRVTGDLVCGDVTFTEKELEVNSCHFLEEYLAHPLDDDYHKERSPKWDKIQTPLLSSANWGGQGLHPRGNFEGFVRAASSQKWLEVHGIEHWTEFYTDYGVNLQKRFLDYFLKGEDNGWDKQPPVQLLIRSLDENFVEHFTERHENEWPLARTNWTKFYLHPAGHELKAEAPKESAKIEFDACGEGVTFFSAPLTEETEITGPLAAKLFVSSNTSDADLFLVFRVFTADMREVVFHGAEDPHTPVAQGWLRASHRKLDPNLSEFCRPYHTHDEKQPLEPGVPVELDVEIWPTCVVVPEGYRIALTVRGKDYEFDKKTGPGLWAHNDPRDRKPEIYHGKTTLHIDKDRQPFVHVPIIPKKK